MKTILFVIFGSIVLCTAFESPIMEYFIPSANRGYSMTIQGLYECISCNKDSRPGNDYVTCLKGMKPQNQRVMQKCCNENFDKEFCEDAALGDIDFKVICLDPKKGNQVEKCFFNNVENKGSKDVMQYRQCKRSILKRFCTTYTETDDE